MSKPQYLLCENPMSKDQGVFILQVRPFFAMAAPLHFETEDEMMEEAAKHTWTGSTSISPEEYVLLVGVWIDDGKLSEISKDADDQTIRMARSIRKMSEWYKSYCIWEDKQA